MVKKITIVTIVTLMLMGCFSLPLFAQSAPSHLIHVYIPIVEYYSSGNETGQTGTANNNWYVRFQEYVYEGYPFEEQDTEYQVTVTQINRFEFMSKDYFSETDVTIFVVDAPTDTKETFSYTTDKATERATGVSLRQNGTNFDLVELYNEVDTEGNTTSYYEWSYRIRVEKGKGTDLHIWLNVPARYYEYQEQIKSDQEIIDELLSQIPPIDVNVSVQAPAGLYDMLYEAIPFAVPFTLLAISLALVGFVIRG